MLALTHSDIGKLICAHTGQRVSLRTDEIQQHFDFAHAILAQLEAVEGVSTLPSTPLPGEALHGTPNWRTADISWACAHLTESTAYDGALILREWEAMKVIALAAETALQQPVQAVPAWKWARFEDWLASPISPPANPVEYVRQAFDAGRAAPGEPGQ